jgi:hypothetical protein
VILENPPSGSRFVPYRRKDRQRGVRKLNVAFRNFANAPKKELDENSPGMFEHFEYTVTVDKKIRAHSESFYLKVNVELPCM